MAKVPIDGTHKLIQNDTYSPNGFNPNPSTLSYPSISTCLFIEVNHRILPPFAKISNIFHPAVSHIQFDQSHALWRSLPCFEIDVGHWMWYFPWCLGDVQMTMTTTGWNCVCHRFLGGAILLRWVVSYRPLQLLEVRIDRVGILVFGYRSALEG